MTRKDIAMKLEKRMNGISSKQADAAVNHIIDIMTHALADGESIYLRGLATIEVVNKKARKCRNFFTGQTLEVAASKGLRIKASKRIKLLINLK